MSLDKVLAEDATMDIVLSGRAIARVGEGELKLAINGWNLKSQKHVPALANEIRALLTAHGQALTGLPRYWRGIPNEPFWARFCKAPYVQHYTAGPYGSAFISRPDVVHAIDRPDYWAKVRSLWAGRDVTLVGPSPKVLKMPEAASVRLIECPLVQAYAEIDRLEEEVGRPAGPVFVVAGATATALAARLAAKGVWALDFGHMGAFMPAAGSFGLDRSTLISAAYLEQNKRLHAKGAYGVSGRKSCADVLAFAADLNAFGMLDYGAGQGTLKKALGDAGFKGPIEEYDPAVKALNRLPKPADLVTCTDVLEHVEPEKLDAVLDHIFTLAKVGVFLVIATRPAKKTLDDGRNAHICLHDAQWWTERLARPGWAVTRQDERPGHDLKVWLTRC